MVTKNPRLSVVLDLDLYEEIQKIAKRQGVSLSLAARDLLKEAIERSEDSYWNSVAEDRDKTYSSKKNLSRKDLWG